MISNFRERTLGCALAISVLGHGPAYAQSAEGRTDWPGPGQLFVGTCYQPVDRSPEQVKRDIALMKQAGFKVVRMGDLSWDYFEPAEGRFDFETFDWIMDEMHAAGIKVILDIPGQPAPIWLHHKYPGVDIVTQQGTRLHAAERYMDNISDPDYKRLVARLADTLTRRYAEHPALLAIGFDNEIGNGFMSYSQADRERFVDWLKKKVRHHRGAEQGLGHAALVAPHQHLGRGVRCPMATGRGRSSASSTCVATGPT